VVRPAMNMLRLPSVSPRHPAGHQQHREGQQVCALTPRGSGRGSRGVSGALSRSPHRDVTVAWGPMATSTGPDEAGHFPPVDYWAQPPC
jgi:hypothetical protein